MSIRAALFDLDGTLIETHIDFHAMSQAMAQMAQAASVPEAAYAGRDILGMVEGAATEIAARGGDGQSFLRSAFLLLEEREVIGCAHPQLLPGTEALLAWLSSQGIKIGIVTRNCRRVSVDLLTRFQLPYDVLLTRDDVTQTKPNPQHLWDALRALHAVPDEAVMVGDHWMDIQAGQRARVAQTIGVLGSHTAEWFAPCPPDVLVRDLSEAEGLFG